jgi:hypothetical protein
MRDNPGWTGRPNRLMALTVPSPLRALPGSTSQNVEILPVFGLGEGFVGDSPRKDF